MNNAVTRSHRDRVAQAVRLEALCQGLASVLFSRLGLDRLHPLRAGTRGRQ